MKVRSKADWVMALPVESIYHPIAIGFGKIYARDTGS
jgi:hypothetical protein